MKGTIYCFLLTTNFVPKNKTNMKHIILLLLLGVCSSAFAQKKIIGKWYLIELFGERNPVEMYRLQRTTKATAGHLINFAKDIGAYLAKNNTYNISGLALGIDTVGHELCIHKTGAILGQGLDLEVYPKENIKLAEKILENNGFLLSELIPKQELSIFSLIKRDRLQSALTSGIIIAETGVKGGTVNTFKYAREQKKKIFISDINREFIEKHKKDLIVIKNSLDFEKKLKNNLEQKNLF